MVCTNALEDLTGGGVILDMGDQIAVLSSLSQPDWSVISPSA